MICGVVATGISGYDVCTACRVVYDSVPQRRMSYSDVLSLINSTIL